MGADHAENTAFRPVHWRVFGICCPATGAVHIHRLATEVHAKLYTRNARAERDNLAAIILLVVYVSLMVIFRGVKILEMHKQDL
jgi:hypothetical protein